MKFLHKIITIFALFALLLTATPPQPAYAATITVDTLDGTSAIDGACSLLEAIVAANTDLAVDGCAAGSGADEIIIGVAGTITPQLTLLLTTDMSIQGHADGTIIDATNVYRGFYINLGDYSGIKASAVTISDLEIINASYSGIYIIDTSSGGTTPFAVTLENLHIHDNAGMEGGGVYYGKSSDSTRPAKVYLNNSIVEDNTVQYMGGGIYMDECASGGGGYTLEITNSIIQNNTATDVDYGMGGGVHNQCGHLLVTDSTISSNTATAGGGIYAAQGAYDYIDTYYTTQTELINTTVANNIASGYGGGVYVQLEDAANYNPSLSIVHSTIVGNDAPTVGGILTYNNDLDIRNTVIADNISRRGGQCDYQGAAPTTNIGNASSDETCGFTYENIISELQPLADNGGASPLGPNGTMGNVTTMALIEASPLLSTADSGECIATDERGETRPAGAGCDIGAFETGFIVTPTPTPEPEPTPASLPATGFAMGRVTILDAQPENKTYTETAMMLEIPKLDVTMPIVGVPQSKSGWDVNWLGNNAGYLAGSAFPTWSGNTVITAHVWDAWNQAGAFSELKSLNYGDQVQIKAWGLTYTYEVRESKLVTTKNVNAVLQSEDYDWVTLVTCEFYNPFTGDYLFRRAVRAVLISVK